MKYFVTFGQTHKHCLPGFLHLDELDEPVYEELHFDKDCVAIINAEDEKKARDIAFNNFGNKWCFLYPWVAGKSLDEITKWYPRGEIILQGDKDG